MKLLKIYPLLFFIVFSCDEKKSEPVSDTTPEVTIAYETDAALGEGALWNHNTNTLYWIDIEGKTLNIYDPKTNKNRAIATPSRIGTVVPTEDGNTLVALEDGVYKLNTTTEEITRFADMSEPLKDRRLNDGKCDPAGRFWVGSMHMAQKAKEAKLYAVKNSETVTVMVDSVTISNGIVWTSDKSTMYYIDTPTSEIKAYDYDNATGNITNPRVAVKIPEDLGYPDGMATDAEDMVWVGMWNGNAVIRFNPKTGEVLQKIEVPAHNVTSCAFGGDNLETLYITSAKLDMTEEEEKAYPLSGSVFKVKPGVRGVKSNAYKEQ